MNKLFPIYLLLLAGLTACQESFDKRLQREAHDYTQQHCPVQVEPGNRLDSTSYTPSSRTYTSWFSLDANYEQALNGNEPLLRQRLLDELAGNVDYKSLMDHEVTFRYVYRSQATGRTVYDTRIEAHEYKGR